MPSNYKKKVENEPEQKRSQSILDGISTIIRTNITFPTCKQTDTTLVLKAGVVSASEGTSISGYCSMHTGLPSHTTCLSVLHRLDLEEMIHQSSTMFKCAGKDVIRPGQKYTFAIDKTGDPYYGKRDHSPGSFIVGGKRKASTNYFFTYLTLSIIDKDRHLTLFAIPWHNGMSNVTAIKQCIDVIFNLNLKIHCICLDREFYTAEIIKPLQSEGIPHLIPVKKHGNELKEKLKGKKSNTFSYTINAESKDAVTVNIVDCLVYLKGKGEKHGIEHHAFIVYGVSCSPKSIRRIYKHRFAIESNYRLRNTTKPKTSSNDGVLRYFYTLVSFMMQNWWIAMKWELYAKMQRGPKVVKRNNFTLAYFAALLRAEATEIFALRIIRMVT
jgi:putative transposase